MKMLLTIWLKIPHNLTEVMVVPMVLLLALKLIRSGVPHKRLGGGGGGFTGPPFFKKVCWERGGDLF